MKRLPYRARTATGDTFDVVFPLHDETGNAVRVDQLVSAILDAGNGDVLQAAAMALAIRARMIHAPPEVTVRLTAELVESALAAVAAAERESPPVGHA